MCFFCFFPPPSVTGTDCYSMPRTAGKYFEWPLTWWISKISDLRSQQFGSIERSACVWGCCCCATTCKKTSTKTTTTTAKPSWLCRTRLYVLHSVFFPPFFPLFVVSPPWAARSPLHRVSATPHPPAPSHCFLFFSTFQRLSSGDVPWIDCLINIGDKHN